MSSLINDMQLIQGDSSTIFKFGESSGQVLDANWQAKCSITDLSNNSVVIQKDLVKDAEGMNFIFQIVPAESELLLTSNKYMVAIQITNESINFNAEVAQFKLKILPQYVE